MCMCFFQRLQSTQARTTNNNSDWQKASKASNAECVVGVSLGPKVNGDEHGAQKQEDRRVCMGSYKVLL